MKGKVKVMAMVYRDWDKPYDLLLKWLHAIEEYNPDFLVKFISIPTGYPTYVAFDHIIWIFALLIKGFKYC